MTGPAAATRGRVFVIEDDAPIRAVLEAFHPIGRRNRGARNLQDLRRLRRGFGGAFGSRPLIAPDQTLVEQRGAFGRGSLDLEVQLGDAPLQLCVVDLRESEAKFNWELDGEGNMVAAVLHECVKQKPNAWGGEKKDREGQRTSSAERDHPGPQTEPPLGRHAEAGTCRRIEHRRRPGFRLRHFYG